MEIRTIGIDLGKTVFHMVGLDARGEVVVRKKCSRDQILRFTANLQAASRCCTWGASTAASGSVCCWNPRQNCAKRSPTSKFASSATDPATRHGGRRPAV